MDFLFRKSMAITCLAYEISSQRPFSLGGYFIYLFFLYRKSMAITCLAYEILRQRPFSLGGYFIFLFLFSVQKINGYHVFGLRGIEAASCVIWMSRVTHGNESRRTREWVMSHLCLNRMNESCGTCEWVVWHMWVSRVAHVSESCGICGWVVCHMWMKRG